MIVKQDIEGLTPNAQGLLVAQLILNPFSASILHFHPEPLIKTQNEETSIPRRREWVKEKKKHVIIFSHRRTF